VPDLRANPGSRRSIDKPGIALLFLLTVVTVDLTVPAHIWLLGAENFRRYWPYDPEVGLAVVICAVYIYTPPILELSRWRPKWVDVAVGITSGMLIAWIQFLLTGPGAFKAELPGSSILPIVLAGPVLEEILFRGIFLRLLQDHFKAIAAILLATAMGAMTHSNVWTALFPQLVFCLLYACLGRSLFAPIACHVVSNMILYFPILREVLGAGGRFFRF
jgi:membrane protease YdiL (CAAX protease family)